LQRLEPTAAPNSMKMHEARCRPRRTVDAPIGFFRGKHVERRSHFTIIARPSRPSQVFTSYAAAMYSPALIESMILLTNEALKRYGSLDLS
jgi:hypothetical protein